MADPARIPLDKERARFVGLKGEFSNDTEAQATKQKNQEKPP
jgi:hypothetical protein